MTEPKDPADEEPLPVEIEWGEPKEAKLTLGEISEPEEFELGYTEDGGLALVFPKGNLGLLFKGEAQQKLLFLFDVMLHSMLNSDSHAAFEEGAAGGKKKVTLH